MSKSNITRINGTIKPVEAGMKECLNSEGVSLSKATSMDKGRAFMQFYTQDIARYLDNWSNFDENRFDSCFCDGRGDLGIDFVYEHLAPEDKRFWICQSKYKGSGASLARGDISNFFEIHKRILDKPALARGNRMVQDLLSEFDESSMATFVLLTNGEASDDNLKEFERLRKNAKDDAGGSAENFEWKLVDLKEIENQYVKIQSFEREPPNVKMHVQPSGKNEGYIEADSPSPDNKKTYKTIVITVKGTELATLYKEHDQSLFNDNIRGFLGGGVKKNKKMKNTLKEKPELFYLFNNGISAVCGSFGVKEDRHGVLVDCKDFQIINGAQTVSVIGEFDKEFRNDHQLGKNLEKVRVLMRITETERVKELNKEIIEANNTQNIIRDADFHSNDPIQISIKNQFEKYEFKYQADGECMILKYMPKRIYTGGIRIKNNLLVKMEDFTKALYAFNFDYPDKLNSQTDFLFDDSDGGSYGEIFRNPDISTSMPLTKEKTEKLAAIAMLSHYLTIKLKGKMNEKEGSDLKYPKDSLYGMALRAGRHVLWAFGYIVRNLPKGEKQKTYKKILDGSAFKQDGFAEIWLNRIVKLIEKQLRSDSEVDQKALNFKSWLRDRKKVRKLIEEIDYDMQDGVRAFRID